MSGFRWILLLCSIGVRFGFAQEYSYTHYDITEGLAGSTAYSITQDADGFIWVGTETGVSRFDGTHFRTYTSADGLPDAEVLQLFGDSKGRVWMAPFGGSVCYYFQGRIHNTENDSILNVMRLHDNSIENFAEDAEGNILIQEKAALHVVGVSGLVRNYDSVGGRQIDSSAACSRSLDGHFTVQIGEKIFELSGSGVFGTNFHPLNRSGFDLLGHFSVLGCVAYKFGNGYRKVVNKWYVGEYPIYLSENLTCKLFHCWR